MALTQVKTWTKDTASVNSGEGPTPQPPNAIGYDTMNRQLMFELKEILIGANGNWTVASSCGYDDGSWTNGAADYWTVANDVRWQEVGGEYSWIVLQNNAIATGFQMMFALEQLRDSTEYFDTIYFSHSGSFTGGTSTARPTASDEYYIETTANTALVSSYENAKANVLMSTDGECTRIIFSRSGELLSRIHVELPKVSTGLSATYFEGRCLTAFPGPGYDLTQSPSHLGHAVRAGGDACRWAAVTEGMGNQGSGNAPHMQGVDYAGNRTATPLYACVSEGVTRGVLGEMVDIYMVDATLADGDYAPSSGSMDWVVLSDFLLANDGTAFVL